MTEETVLVLIRSADDSVMRTRIFTRLPMRRLGAVEALNAGFILKDGEWFRKATDRVIEAEIALQNASWEQSVARQGDRSPFYGKLPIKEWRRATDADLPADATLREGWRDDGKTVHLARDKLPRRGVMKSVIISRLTEDQVAAALALLTPKQMERWRAPDKPFIYADDPETVAILEAIGADVDEVMAP